jgi:hypothetical protein
MGLTGLRDVAAELGHTEPTVYGTHPFRHTRRDRRIDYVFVRDGAGLGLHGRDVHRAFDEVFELAGRPASFSDHAGVVAEIELLAGAGSPLAAPDLDAVALASSTLAEGRADATRRRRRDRLAAGLGLGGALLAGVSVRDRRVTRRRLLRTSLQGAAALALAPALGFSLLSEVYAPDELRAFDQLAARLDAWREPGAWIARAARARAAHAS